MFAAYATLALKEYSSGGMDYFMNANAKKE